jgi:hypothetical protein
LCYSGDSVKDSHGFPLVTVGEVCVRKCPFDEPTKDGTAARAECASCKNKSRDLACRAIVAKENETFASEECIEEDYDGVCESAICVQMWMEGPRDVLWSGKRLDKRYEGVLHNAGE